MFGFGGMSHEKRREEESSRKIILDSSMVEHSVVVGSSPTRGAKPVNVMFTGFFCSGCMNGSCIVLHREIKCLIFRLMEPCINFMRGFY